MTNVLKAEKISKLYRLGEVGSGTISNDLNAWWARVRGKENPNTLVGQENDRSLSAQGDFVWALKDINFEVKEGEVLGIVGRNGAGKSTLLKILSQITSPTTGVIKSKGRIASLLEVGTGMHPEMTARENIYLNGAILGMRKREIASKFDEIIEFSGCSMYVDTPIKRFSSGMRVRLGFAVAAYLEPEILVIDEVLAVGDAEFQKKAIGKMKDVSKDDGRTILFVSHNMIAVQTLCDRAILMQNGQISNTGQVEDVVDQYLRLNSALLQPTFQHDNISDAPGNEHVRIRSMNISQEKLTIEDSFHIDIEIANTGKHTGFVLAIDFVNINEVVAFGTGVGVNAAPGKTQTIRCHIPAHLMNDDEYTINLYVLSPEKSLLYTKNNILSFEIHDAKRDELGYLQKVNGVVRPKLEWSTV